MARHSIRAKIESGTEVEVCLDSALLLDLKYRTLKLEQKVTQLFETLREPVYRYLVATFSNPAEAEEITQEAFLRLYRHLHSGQAINDVRSWIFRVAHNLAVDALKNNKHFTPNDPAAWNEICQLIVDPSLDPEQVVLQREKYERLHAALNQLSPQQRQCLHLRAEGFRYREIAEILEIDISSVVEFLRRGIKRLIAQINE